MKQAHTLREYQYYDKDTLCSIIDADFTTKQVRVENKVDSILDTAFGVNTESSWRLILQEVTLSRFWMPTSTTIPSSSVIC